MSKKDEALKLALEALNRNDYLGWQTNIHVRDAIREALAEQPEQQQEPVAVCDKCHGLGYYDEGHECDDGSMVGGNYVECDKCKHPEFIKHKVEHPYDWSEWVCPNPKSYLMKCCDCGLVHEAQFGVVRYKSETEREDCDMVNDSNLQAVFRMRRSEQWSPEDTAYRPGGLPQEEQPAPVAEPHAQQEPVGEVFGYYERGFTEQKTLYGKLHNQDLPVGAKLYTSPPASKPWVGLTDEERQACTQSPFTAENYLAIEAKLKEKNQ